MLTARPQRTGGGGTHARGAARPRALVRRTALAVRRGACVRATAWTQGGTAVWRPHSSPYPVTQGLPCAEAGVPPCDPGKSGIALLTGNARASGPPRAAAQVSSDSTSSLMYSVVRLLRSRLLEGSTGRGTGTSAILEGAGQRGRRDSRCGLTCTCTLITREPSLFSPVAGRAGALVAAERT